MGDKKRSFIGLAFLSMIVSILAAVGVSKLFPAMMRRCKEMCEKEGFEPPEFCKKMMEKCCPPEKGKK